MTDERPARILVIDDEVTQRILVKEYLEEAGYVVRLSDDGKKGLKMAAATSPDLIILDLMLPSIDGYSLCKALKQAEATAHVPIILITASREPGVIEKGLASGADDFVTKPVDWAFLADRVNFVLARAQQAANATVQAEDSQVAADELAKAEAASAEAQAEAERVREEAAAQLSAAEQQYAETLQSYEAKLQEQQSVAEQVRAELSAVAEKHEAEMRDVEARTQEAIAAAKDEARVEAEQAAARHADELETVRSQSDSSVRDQDEAVRVSLEQAEERHQGEIRALQEEHEQEIAALKASFESRLHSVEADMQAFQTCKQDDVNAELAEAAGTCWAFTRSASTANLEQLGGIAERLKVAASAATSESQASLIKDIESHVNVLGGSLGKLRVFAQAMDRDADYQEAPCDLSQMLVAAVSSVKGLANSRRVSVDVSGCDAPFAATADQSRLNYAIVSLLANAIRFTPAGGAVNVALSPAEGGACIQISDNGVGIAPALLDKISSCLERPASMTAEAGKGLGFGIPIASALVRQHGGSLEIASALGRGTDVSIVLPHAAGAHGTSSNTTGTMMRHAS